MAEQTTLNEEFLDTLEAEEASTIERCLTFKAGDLILYISTRHVIEIINNYSITNLPLVPPYIKGIINLRGQVLPVVDIQMRMGKAEAEVIPASSSLTLILSPLGSLWIPCVRSLILTFRMCVRFR